MYLIFQPFFCFFFLLYTPCLLGVLTFYIHLAWFVSVPSFICQLIFLNNIVYMFSGLGQEAWPPCLLGAFPFICLLFLKKINILCTCI
jgi:hypothetical protein